MISTIKGITVNLHVKEQNGTDDFGRPIYTDTIKPVDNVLVTPMSSADMASELNVLGKTIQYELSIPKGDTNNWIDTEVEFFGQRFMTVGYPEELIEEMVPLSWNKKVKVERYG